MNADALLPPGLDPDDRRRARLVVLTAIAVVLVAIPLAIRLWLTHGRLTPTVVAFIVGSVAMIANVWLLRLTADVRRISMVVCGQLLVLLAFMSWANGGPEAAAQTWNLAIPPTAAFLVGRRFAWICGGIVAVETIGFWALKEAGIVFPRPLGEIEMRWWDMAGLATAALFMTWLASTFEALRRESLERAEAGMAAKGRFLSKMSHELRTPLNGVIGLTELLQNTHLDPEQKEYSDGVLSSGRALLKLVERVMAFSELDQDPQLESSAFDVVKVCRSIVEDSASRSTSKGLTVTVEGPSAGVVVTADRRRVRQVVEILVENAIQYTDAGSVKVSVRTLESDLVVEVRDTGPGFGDDTLFEPFVQGDDADNRVHQGAGLGLALAQRVAAALGGELEAVSSAAGSTFSLRIPTPGA